MMLEARESNLMETKMMNQRTVSRMNTDSQLTPTAKPVLNQDVNLSRRMAIKLSLRASFLCLLACGIFFAAPNAAQAQEGGSVMVEAFLIRASNNGDSIDKALLPHKESISRLFKFKSFKVQSSKKVSINVPDQSMQTLGDGYTVELRVVGQEKANARLGVNWKNGDRKLMDTSVKVSSKPLAIGGVRDGNDTMILLILMK